MGGRSPISGLGLALLLFLVVTTQSAEEKCRTGCHGVKPNYFKYVEQTTYKYNFESTADISISSAEGQASSTKIKGTVLLTQQPECNQVLRLQNVQVIGSDGKKHGTIPDVEKPIRINFHDGHVEDVICAESGDTQNSLNIKRAVASLFQAALNHHHETDVFGLCPTDFQSSKSGNILSITKTRHLDRCSHRETAQTDFISTAFNLHSEIKSSPLLKADYTSEQRIKDGVLDHVLVTENYLYTPFSVGKKGAKAVVQTKLQFEGKVKDAAKQKCTEPKSIIFDNPHPVISDKSDVHTILQAIKDTASTIKTTVDDTTAAKFADLVRILGHAKKDDLLAVYNQIKAGAGFSDKTVGKEVFLDALFRTGTGEAVEVAVELLKNKELSELEKKLVYLGLTFVKHATPASLSAVGALLDQPNLPREAYLGIGALVSRYCHHHNCKNVKELNGLLQKLLSKLTDKPANREQENEVMAILKSLGNTKHLTDAVIPKIINVAKNKANPTRVRVAALETYLADPCKDALRDSAISILKDIQQDSEIRIKAYLALAKCPNGKVANVIKNVLDNEPSYQVGGFIVSHIRNLRASANPDKELAKRELGNINTMKRFPIDIRKYSFNSELSYAFDTLGSSSSSESNVIYSQSSYVPRSASLNLTTEIFGHKFNFLEIEARQENLDRVLEHYFGPLGVIRNKNPEDLYESGKTSIGKIVEHAKERFAKTRGKRQVPKAEIESIGKSIQIKTHELNTDLDLDLSVKIFGSELLFLSLNKGADKITPELIIDKIFDKIDRGIEIGKHFDHTFRRNGIFLHGVLNYPTSSGFPLRLAITGTSSVQIKASGSIDVKAILSGSTDNIFKVSLIPSVNIDVAGRITIAAGVVENGLKVVSNGYTAVGGAIEVESFNTGKGIDVKVSSPVDKQEIFAARHEFHFISRDTGAKEVETLVKFVENKDFSICLDNLSPIIGLTACAEFNGPNTQLNQGNVLPWPLSGNSKLRVWIEKDEDITYHFRDVLYTDDNKRGFTTTLETIGPNNERKVSLQIEAYATPDKFIKATLDSPIKKAVFEARITDNEHEKSASAHFSHDGQEYSGKLGVKIAGNAAKSIYTPLIEYTMPNHGTQKLPYAVEGAIVAEVNGETRKYTFDKVKLVAPDRKPISITGYVGKEPSSYFADLAVSDGDKSGSFKGKAQFTPGLLKLDAELKNSVHPSSDFHFIYELKHSHESLESDLTIAHGNDLNSKTNRIKLSNSIVRKFTDVNDYKYGTDNEFSYPLVGVGAEFEFEVTPKSFKYDIEGKYNSIQAGSELDLKYNQKNKGDYDGSFKFNGLENKVKAHFKRDIQGDKSKINNNWEVNGMKMELNGVITHQIKPNDVEVGAQLTYKCDHIGETITLDHSLVYGSDELKEHLKINKGSQVIIDYDIKAHRTNGANGHLKVNLKDILTANGEIKADKWNGKAFVVFDFHKIGRKIKTEAIFKLTAPNYNVAFVLHPNYEKDNKKLTINSENEIKEGSVDSKNHIDVFGEKLEVNFKGHGEGKPHDGKISQEIEVILPSDIYFGGKFAREIHVVDGIINGHVFVSGEQRKNKNTPGHKASFKVVHKDFNTKEHTFDTTVHVALDNSNDKNLNFDLTAKRHKEHDKKTLDVIGKIYGSIIPDALELDVISNCEGAKFDFDINGKFGTKATATFTGKHTHAVDGKPREFELKFDGKSDGKIKSVHYFATGTSLRSEHGCDLTGSTKFHVDDQIKQEGDFKIKVGRHDGHIKTSWTFQKHDPITLEAGYDHKEDDGVKKCHGDGSLHYGKGKVIKCDATIIRPNDHESNIDFKLDTPYEQLKSGRIEAKFKHSEDHKHFNAEADITHDGKKHNFVGEFTLSDVSPSFKYELKHPDGRLDKYSFKVINSGNKHFNSEVSIACSRTDFTLDGSIDANFASADNLVVTVKVDSPKLKLNKIVLEAKHKHQGGGKLIVIHATSNGENIIDGSTSYKTHEEGGKYSAEGSGDVTYKGQKKSVSIKLYKQNFDFTKNGEQGVQITFDAGLGDEAIDAEFKVTDKQFRVASSYCEKKKECAHFEVDAKTKFDANEYNSELEISIDLRKLGLLYEFGAKSVTNRKGLHFDHTTDIHLQSKDNKKYQYSFYVHPKEAKLSLTTPKREISLEGKLDITNARPKHVVKGDVALYLNKKTDPTKKTGLSFVMDQTNVDKDSNVAIDVVFTAPGLPKDLKVNYKGDYNHAKKHLQIDVVWDVFEKAADNLICKHEQQFLFDQAAGKHKWDVHTSFKSKGLGIDIVHESVVFYYDSKTHTYKHSNNFNYKFGDTKFENSQVIEIDPSKFHAHVKYFNKDLLTIDSNYAFSSDSQVIDTITKVCGTKSIKSHVELKNYNAFKYTLAWKDDPSKQLVISSSFIPGQVADFTARTTQDELIHAAVKLDEANFLKPEYSMNSENIKTKLLKPIQGEIQNVFKEGKELVDSVAEKSTAHFKHANEILKTSLPDVKPTVAYYKSEADKVREEIETDKHIQEISTYLKNVFGVVAKFIHDILETARNVLDGALATIKKHLDVLRDSYEHDFVPKFKEYSHIFLTEFKKLFEHVTDMLFTILGKISEFIDAHQKELKQIAAAIADVVHGTGKLIVVNFEKARAAIIDSVRKIIAEIKSLPIYEEFKAKYDVLLEGIDGWTEPLGNLIKDALTTLKDIAPNEELKKFIDALSDYIDKKLKREKVDDIAAIGDIVHRLIASIKQLLNHKFDFKVDSNIFSLNSIGSIPRLVAAKFSPLNYLAGDVPLESFKESLYSVSFNPRSWLPPYRLYAFVVQGQHIFTFDGKHITFPGKCNYLLARDAVNGNFTIAGTYTNGFLTALTVADKTDTITVKKGGQCLHNKDAAEFPIRKGLLEAHRHDHSVHIRSKAGVSISCDPQLVRCTISVSGFYHGQIRGLLGNGNNEPFDDFTLPNGKIVTSESDFGNAYKTQAACAPVKTVDHSTHHHAPSCTELFGANSEFRLCYPFVNPENFRTACDHGVASGVKDTEYAIASGYVAACNSKFIFVHVPKRFLKCTNSDTPKNFGDTFSVKVPGKAADIVIVIDETKLNEPVYNEFIQPLVTEITKELATKGITDVEFNLLGYGGEHKYFATHYTNGGKISWKGKLPAIKFSDAPEAKKFATGCEKLDHFLNTVKSVSSDFSHALGTDVQSLAYLQGIIHPYRAHAAKTLIAVTGNACHQGMFLGLQKMKSLLWSQELISINLVTPFRDFKVKDAKTTKTIIGFNKEHVFTTGEVKKKPIGSSELHKDLEYNDYCIDYTIKNEGNVFVTDNFLAANKQQRKLFVQSASHNIAEQLTSTEKELDCRCNFISTQDAHNYCSVQNAHKSR